MKQVFLLVLVCALAVKSFAQHADSTRQLADAIEKLFTWHAEKSEKQKLIYLDVPFQRNDSDSTEFLRLTVAKDSGRLRPAYIMVSVPGDISQSDGIFIKLAKTVVKGGQQSIEFDDADPVRIGFESCDNDYCAAKMTGGFASNASGTKEDIFRKFISFDYVFFLFMYGDGSHKSVAVPMFSFQEQYPKL